MFGKLKELWLIFVVWTLSKMKFEEFSASQNMSRADLLAHLGFARRDAKFYAERYNWMRLKFEEARTQVGVNYQSRIPSLENDRFGTRLTEMRTGIKVYPGVINLRELHDAIEKVYGKST